VLLGTPLQASLSPHLLNVPVQIANKHGLQKKKKDKLAHSTPAVINLISDNPATTKKICVPVVGTIKTIDSMEKV
jgi:hypothetical protein